MGVLFSASANATPASGTNVATHTINSAEHQVMHLGDASGSILGTAASPLHAALTNSPSVFVTSTLASPLWVQLSDGVDSATITAASRLATDASIIGGSVALLAGANVIGTASVIQSGTWALSASVVNSASVVVTNQISASITAGSIALLSGANVIGAASAIQSGAWTTSVTNLAGSAAGSPLFVSIAGSAALLAGANVIGSASVIQGTAAAITAPWPVKISDGTDSANVDSASRQWVVVTDGTNNYGVAGSPIPVIAQANQIYWAGSLLTIQSVNLSASISGCTPIVASLAGFATVIVSATFTTSGCQRIGWTACGNSGAASALVQTPMPFGTNGGMDANRLPHGHIWSFPSGSIAVLTTTSACYVAGTLDILQVAS